MNELELIFENRKLIESTKKIYRQSYNKIKSIADITKPLYTFSFDDIMWLINQDPTLSESYRRKIICFFINVKNYYDPNDIDLPVLRNQIQVVANNIADKRVADFSKEDTNQFDAIESWIQNLSDPQQYIVNYIIFYLNTRNLDLIAKVIHDIDYDTTLDDTINYLMVYSDHVIFIRNMYKTVGTYGKKVNTISDNKFLNFIRQIKNDSFILNNNTNTIHQMIMRRTYNNLSESKYLHNVLQKYKHDINKLLEIEKNRGSNIRTLLTNYNSDFTNGQSSSSLV